VRRTQAIAERSVGIPDVVGEADVAALCAQLGEPVTLPWC
jgi:hypothetical protein